MYHYNFDESFLIRKNNLTKEEMLEAINKLLSLINKQTGEYAINQHLIWRRYDSWEDIKKGMFNNGLYVRTVGLASTSIITGNTKNITPTDVLSYSYATRVNSGKTNAGFVIPLSFTDEKGRKINLALDKEHAVIPWDEGKMCSILDFILLNKSYLSNTYTLFIFEINPNENIYNYRINKKAFPFLSDEEKQKHFYELSKLVKNILVKKYKVLTEEEYDNAKDINPYIEQLIADEYEKVKDTLFSDPIYWEEP